MPFNNNPQDVVNAIPAATDAVLYGAFPDADTSSVMSLIEKVNNRRLPSFSLSGEKYVHMGALATNNPDTDWKRLARYTAIHIQEVLQGAPAEQLPVYFEASDRLLINMATSRQIFIAPDFDTLGKTELLNVDSLKTDITYNLTKVARTAVEVNLALAAQRLRAAQAGKRVNEARGKLLPRIEAGVGYQRLKETYNTRNGFSPEESFDGTVNLTQPLLNEELWASFTIEKLGALSEKELLRETELDIIQSAVTAYLNVLREQTSLQQKRYNLDITRQNYRLSQTRVKIGDSDKSDLYRWESELANAKQEVLEAKSQLEQRKQILNRILNRPISESFATTVETLDNPDLLISDERITLLINNRYSLEALTDFFVETGIERSPELKKVRAQIDADKRRLLSEKLSYLLPDVDLTAQYTRNFDEKRSGGIPTEGNDWRIGVELSIPLFEGGAHLARQARSRLAVMEGEANFLDARNAIEQEIRSQMEEAHASYQSIELAGLSETAAKQSYDLVASSYAQGQVAITDLLDSQKALIQAGESSMNATYSFLVDLMNLQRAIGAFDFFLTDKERMRFSRDLTMRIGERQLK